MNLIFRLFSGRRSVLIAWPACWTIWQVKIPPATPPYNIEKLDDDSYQISMAVAGFSEADLNVEIQDNQLKITGRHDGGQDAEKERSFLHRGIAERAFERRFSLAEFIKVEGAKLENGLLHVKLTRIVPEAKKPRSVPISNGDNQKAIENK